MKRALQIIFSCLFVSFALWAMLQAIAWRDVREDLLLLNWLNIVLIIGLVLLMGVIKATRFFYILRYGEVKVSWKNAVRIFIASLVLSPIPAGEVGRAMLFKKELDVHLSQTAGPVFLQALMELWSATLWVIFAAFFVGFPIGWWLIGLLGLLALLSAPLLASSQLTKILEALQARGKNYAWIEKVKTTLHHFHALISPQGKTKNLLFWIRIVGLALLVQAIGGGLLWYIAQLVGVPITILQGVFAAAMAALIQGVFTIIPGGLGVTEGGLVGILSGFGVSWHQTVVVTLLFRVATLPLAILIALCFLLPIYGKNILHYFQDRYNTSTSPPQL